MTTTANPRTRAERPNRQTSRAAWCLRTGRRLTDRACAALALPAAVGAVGCAHQATGAEPAIARGGELADAQPERAAMVITPDRVTVWGSAEVPDGSRLSTAYAGVDAITRSELLKAVRVRVTAILTDVESTDERRRIVILDTVEAVEGILTHAGPMPHGWARVRRGNGLVLRVWARLDVPRAALDGAVGPALERAGTSNVPGWAGRLTLAEEDDAASVANENGGLAARGDASP